MGFDLSWIPVQSSPFQKLVLEVPSRELRQFLRLELTRERGILFNSKLIEPEDECAEQPDGAPCPTFGVIRGVLLDLLTSSSDDFYVGDLELLGCAIGDAGSVGRSLRIVRHSSEIASLFHSYFKLGCTPEMAPAENINRNWQARLWERCLPEIRSRMQVIAQDEKSALRFGADPLHAKCPPATYARPDNIQADWSTALSSRSELRWVADKIVKGVRDGSISDLSKVVVVLPPRKTQEYAVQLSGVFSEEFQIPFMLNESLNSAGVGFAPAFLQVLELLLHGGDKSMALSLMQHDAFSVVRDAAEEDLLESWCGSLGVVLGLDASDLRDTFIPSADQETAYQWLQATDRLALLALDVPDADSATGVPRSMLPLAQRVVHFVTVLTDFRANSVRPAKPLSDWSKSLLNLSHLLFAERDSLREPSAETEFQELNRTLARLSADGTTGTDYDFTMVCELLRGPLKRPRRRSSTEHRYGVTVLALKKGALRVPFEHVFVLGAEDGQMPRISRVSGMHLFPEKALQHADTVGERDKEALRELLLFPGRKIHISHVEKNIANGEKKRPSHEILNLLPQFNPENIFEAPPVRAQQRSKSDSNIFTVSDKKSVPPAEHLSERKFGLKTISTNALSDLMKCPVVGRARHRTGIAESPIPKEDTRFPDAELSFIERIGIYDNALRLWLGDERQTPSDLKKILGQALAAQEKRRAVPASNRIDTELEALGTVFNRWMSATSDLRPSVLFSLGRRAQSRNCLILPEVILKNTFKISGKLPAHIHYSVENKTVTATVTTFSNLKESRKKKQYLHFETSAQAILSLTSLMLVEAENSPNDVRPFLAQVQSASHWQIRVLSQYADSTLDYMEKTIDAWTRDAASEWLMLWADLLISPSAPKLLPLKIIYDDFILNDKKAEDIVIDAKFKSRFEEDGIGSGPYKSRWLNGNAVINCEFEDNPGEVLMRRYPWCFDSIEGCDQ